MAEQSQITMAKIGSTLSWADIEDEERRSEGRPPRKRAASYADPMFAAASRLPRTDKALREFYATDRRNNGPSGAVLLLASFAVVVVVVALVGLTLAA
jgi:hypothetical protein